MASWKTAALHNTDVNSAFSWILGVRQPGAPTEVLLLSDSLAAMDRLPVCTVVGASLCGGLFVLCRRTL